MLDLAQLRRIQLTRRPFGQRFVGGLGLGPNFALARTKVIVEDIEKVPDEPVIFAMNHTDRYNYWPFQYRLWKALDRFTATWVKGKYYERPSVARFMEATNNLPTVSRGYLITKDFGATVGRKPTDDEYKALRSWVNADAAGDTQKAPDGVPDGLLILRRNMLGRVFSSDTETYAQAVNALFREMMSVFLELHDKAFGVGLDLLIFPQGTRSVRLSRGRIGLAQVALHYKRPVVPVGCSGSDKVYPGGNPFAKRGKIVYRIGDPIRYEDMASFHIQDGFVPFTAEAEATHQACFQGYVDVIMERINDLVDEPYKWPTDNAGPGADAVSGSQRFV